MISKILCLYILYENNLFLVARINKIFVLIGKNSIVKLGTTCFYKLKLSFEAYYIHSACNNYIYTKHDTHLLYQNKND